MTYGHAIEVRLYAEDPAADWQPQSGVLTLVDVPGVDGEFDLLNRPGLRLDAGFESGSEVSTHYDAMLAKVVSWAPTPRAGRPSAGGRPARRPDPRGGHQPRPARRHPRGPRLPGRRGEHGVPRRPSDRPAAARRGRGRRRGAGPRRARRGCPPGPARRPGRLAQRRQPAPAHPLLRVVRPRFTRGERRGGRPDQRRVVGRAGRVRRRRAHRGRGREPDRVVLERDGVRRRTTSRSPATRSTSTRRPATCADRRPAVHRPGRRRRERQPARADARHRRPGRGGGGRRRSRRARPCSCSRR